MEQNICGFMDSSFMADDGFMVDASSLFRCLSKDYCGLIPSELLPFFTYIFMLYWFYGCIISVLSLLIEGLLWLNPFRIIANLGNF